MTPLALQKIDYGKLNSRQQETYNFHMVSARLAEYGYNSILLSDDWLGADFIAYHNDGKRFYRIQLKSRMTINKKYIGRGLYIAFIHGDQVFVCPHDEMVKRIEAADHINNSSSWSKRGLYHWKPPPPAWLREQLTEFMVSKSVEGRTGYAHPDILDRETTIWL